MNTRNTAGRLGFVKDSEGVYRKGNFVFKNGKIMRESQIVPEGTIKDLKDDYVTLDECIRSILSYSTTLGDLNPRATNVYIDKVGNGYKPSKSLSKNTVAVVMSNRQVMELKPRNILDQDSSKLKPEDKPAKAKAIKDFSKPTEFSKLRTESAGKKIKLKEEEVYPDSDLFKGMLEEVHYVLDSELDDPDNSDNYDKLNALTEEDLRLITDEVLDDDELSGMLNETISYYIYHYDKML